MLGLSGFWRGYKRRDGLASGWCGWRRSFALGWRGLGGLRPLGDRYGKPRAHWGGRGPRRLERWNRPLLRWRCGTRCRGSHGRCRRRSYRRDGERRAGRRSRRSLCLALHHGTRWRRIFYRGAALLAKIALQVEWPPAEPADNRPRGDRRLRESVLRGSLYANLSIRGRRPSTLRFFLQGRPQRCRITHRNAIHILRDDFCRPLRLRPAEMRSPSRFRYGRCDGRTFLTWLDGAGLARRSRRRTGRGREPWCRGRTRCQRPRWFDDRRRCSCRCQSGTRWLCGSCSRW